MTDLGGLDFNFTFAPGVSLDQMIGFEMAGEFWSQHLADNATINIFVEMTDYLPENVIGGALPGIEDRVRYGDFRQKLAQDITSDIDSLINNNQQDELEQYTVYFDSLFTDEVGHKVDNNEYIKMTRANAKALDLINPHDTGLDGYILMRDLDGVDDGALNDIRWHYDYSNNPIPNDRLDFLSVAIHEIGHSLGFISGLDQANWLAEKMNLNAGNEEDYYSDLTGNIDQATPVDLLRFSTDSYTEGGEGEGWIDMTIGANSYLSFNGGQSPVAYFATGQNTSLGGDGDQASHWKRQGNVLGIMDPVLATGQRRQITELDIQLFNAIGWDLTPENTNSSANLTNFYNQARVTLADKMGIPVGQLDASDASILTPDYLDQDNNGYDDRGEKLQEMVVNSGEVYNWGWDGYWWGWDGYWWGWDGYWQSAADFNQDGFWQNLNWQTVEVSPNTLDVEVESNFVQPEVYVAEVLLKNYFSDFNVYLKAQNNANDEFGENKIDNKLDFKKIVTQLIDNSEIVASTSNKIDKNIDFEVLGDLLPEKLEDMLNLDDELLVMPIN